MNLGTRIENLMPRELRRERAAEPLTHRHICCMNEAERGMEAVYRAIDELDQLPREVIRLRYGLGPADAPPRYGVPTTRRETAKILGMTPEEIRRIEDDAFRQVRERTRHTDPDNSTETG